MDASISLDLIVLFLFARISSMTSSSSTFKTAFKAFNETTVNLLAYFVIETVLPVLLALQMHDTNVKKELEQC